MGSGWQKSAQKLAGRLRTTGGGGREDLRSVELREGVERNKVDGPLCVRCPLLGEEKNDLLECAGKDALVEKGNRDALEVRRKKMGYPGRILGMDQLCWENLSHPTTFPDEAGSVNQEWSPRGGEAG